MANINYVRLVSICSCILYRHIKLIPKRIRICAMCAVCTYGVRVRRHNKTICFFFFFFFSKKIHKDTVCCDLNMTISINMRTCSHLQTLTLHQIWHPNDRRLVRIHCLMLAYCNACNAFTGGEHRDASLLWCLLKCSWGMGWDCYVCGFPIWYRLKHGIKNIIISAEWTRSAL